MRSDVGIVRPHNEDAAWVDPDGRFVIVADGMGGHNAGEVASAMAVEIVRAELERAAKDLAAFAGLPTPPGRVKMRVLVDRAVRAANEAIMARARVEPDKHGMGTTLEIVLILAGEAFITHVGDSRTYLMRSGVAAQLTSDHTVAETLRRAGTLSDQEAQASPLRAALSSVVGVTGAMTIDHVRMRLQPGDRLLVCSDGLYDDFTADELAEACAGGGEGALDALVAEARARGGRDNITGVLVEVLPPEAPDEVEDTPTSPVSLREGRPRRAPFADMGEDTLTDLVEQILRESSRPIALPG